MENQITNLFIQSLTNGVNYYRCKISPKSGKDILVKFTTNELGNILEIKLKAKAEQNQANIALIKFLAKITKLDHSQIKIIQGHHERTKLIKIST